MKTIYLCAVAAALSINKRAKKKNKRRKWMKEWLLKRRQFSHINLLNELKLEPADWFNYLRMDYETYCILLKLVTPLIVKEDTQLRKAITPHERLTATLRFLATGRSYEDLKFSVIISPQALGQIIPETCDAIYKVLKKKYLKLPKTQEEWTCVAKDFEGKWNFPHCLGAVDGKHVQIIPPVNSGSYYYNYKGQHSLVLMAICNANYEFILCDFGTNGRVSDGGVIDDTLFYEKLKNGTLQLPAPSKINGTDTILPYVFVGDEAFALRSDFLKPFNRKQLDNNKRIFNYRLSRSRRLIENVFGILAARFRIFHTAINMKLENIEKVVMACCVLHNFLRRNRRDHYTPASCLDVEDRDTGVVHLGLRPKPNTLVDLQTGSCRHASAQATTVREQFMHYFIREGSVPWQEKFLYEKFD